MHAYAAFVQSMTWVQDRCPDVLPFATAYCAQESSCLRNAGDAGRGFYPQFDFTEEVEKARAMVDPKGHGTLSQAERADLWMNLPTQMLRTGSDLQSWNALWRAVNLTFGDYLHWTDMNDALLGKGQMEWGAASTRWRQVYEMLLRMLQQREENELREEQKTTSLQMVSKQLHDAYTIKICPKFLEFSVADLEELGVPQYLAEQHLLGFGHERPRRATSVAQLFENGSNVAG